MEPLPASVGFVLALLLGGVIAHGSYLLGAYLTGCLVALRVPGVRVRVTWTGRVTVTRAEPTADDEDDRP